MTRDEFIEKWRGELKGYWAEDASRVFWARFYSMGVSERQRMSEDFVQIIEGGLAQCSFRIAKRAQYSGDFNV